jgi:hypothetical protein
VSAGGTRCASPSCRRVSATSCTPYDYPSIKSEWAAIKPETVHLGTWRRDLRDIRRF